MGLEIVELIMRIEEEFAIEIGDGEAEQCATAGQLSQLVATKLHLQLAPSAPCLTSATFFQVRRDLMALTGVSRREIRPKTRLEQIIPTAQRRSIWRELERQGGADLPELIWKSPNSSAIILCSGFGAILFAALVPTFNGFYLQATPFLFAVAAYLAVICKIARSMPAFTDFPLPCETVGGLTRLRMASYLQLSSSDAPISATAKDVWSAMQAIIADELSVPLEEVTPDADFVRDLGVG